MPCMSVSCSDTVTRYAVLGTQLNGAILIRHVWAHNAIHIMYMLWVVSGDIGDINVGDLNVGDLNTLCLL